MLTHQAQLKRCLLPSICSRLTTHTWLAAAVQPTSNSDLDPTLYEPSLQNNTLWLTSFARKRQWIRTDEMSRINPCSFFVTWVAHWLDFLFAECSLVRSRGGCCWQVSIKRRDGLSEKLSSFWNTFTILFSPSCQIDHFKILYFHRDWQKIISCNL